MHLTSDKVCLMSLTELNQRTWWKSGACFVDGSCACHACMMWEIRRRRLVPVAWLISRHGNEFAGTAASSAWHLPDFLSCFALANTLSFLYVPCLRYVLQYCMVHEFALLHLAKVNQKPKVWVDPSMEHGRSSREFLFAVKIICDGNIYIRKY